MVNLLRAEFYKLRKCTAFRITCVLTVLFTAVAYLFRMLVEHQMIGNAQVQQLERMAENNIFYMLHQMYAKSNTILFATVFICIFVITDYSSGAVKNFAGKGFSRKGIYMAKFLAAELGAVAIYLLTALAVLIGAVIAWGPGQLAWPVLAGAASYLSMHIVYLTAYTAIIMMVCEVTRSMAAGICCSILGIMLFSGFLFQGIDLAAEAFGSSVRISEYWIMNVIAGCPDTDIPPSFMIRSGIIAAVWLLVSLAAGMFHFFREDIK